MKRKNTKIDNTIVKKHTAETFLNTIDDAVKLLKLTVKDFGKYYSESADKESYERFEVITALEHPDWSEYVTAHELIKQNFNLTLVQVFGGQEGDGSDYWFIIKLDGQFFKLPAFYDSYADCSYYWDDVHEVTPKRKTITVYDPI